MAKIVLSEAGSIREVILKDQSVIGRGADCDLVISEPKASRKHCNLTRHGDSWVIADLKSSNGTNLNGKRIETDEIITQGDHIVIGVTDIVFQSVNEPDPDHLEPGAFIGGYLLQKEIAKLTTGVVFDALQLSLKRKVTLHIVASALANDRAFAKRFTTDAKQAAKINHTAIASPIDVGAYQGALYVARPEAARGTIETLISAQGALPELAALKLLQSLIGGLSALHRQKQFHLNICPSTVYVADDGEPKLADLEFAALRALPETRSAKGRYGGVPLPDPGFAAPETASDDPLSPASDTYSLACLLFYMTTGVRPFGDGTYEKVLARNANDKRPDPERENGELSPSVAKFIKTGMAVDPAERFATPDAMAADLGSLISRIGKTGPRRVSASAPEPSAPEPSDQTTAGSTAGRGFYYLLLAGNALLVAAAIIAAGLLWLPDGEFMEKLNIAYQPFQPPERIETRRVRPTEIQPIDTQPVAPPDSNPKTNPVRPDSSTPSNTAVEPAVVPSNDSRQAVDSTLAAAAAMLDASDLVGARRLLKAFIQRNEKRADYAESILDVKRLHDETDERINALCRESWRIAKTYSEAKRWPEARTAAMKAIAIDPGNRYAIECAKTLAENDAATDRKSVV